MITLRTFIILLLTLAIPVSGMAAVISAPNCQRMSTASPDADIKASNTMNHGARADQKTDDSMDMGHGGMQHDAADQTTDGENCKSACPCCGSDCACAGAVAFMRLGTYITPDVTQNIIAMKFQTLFSVPFNTPYRPPTLYS